MTKSLRLWSLIAGILAVLLWWPSTVYLRSHHRPKGELHTTLVLDYSGPMDASKSVFHVRVYKIEKPSTGPGDMESIFQNKIELDAASRHVEFMWPSYANTPFAGSDAAIQD